MVIKITEKARGEEGIDLELLEFVLFTAHKRVPLTVFYSLFINISKIIIIIVIIISLIYYIIFIINLITF